MRAATRSLATLALLVLLVLPLAQPLAAPVPPQPGVPGPGVAVPAASLPGAPLPGAALPGVAAPGVAWKQLKEPRVAAFPDGPPNDPNYDRAERDPQAYTIFDEQWNLYSFIPTGTPVAGALGEFASGISADQAWKTTLGRPDVRIAVLDSGIFWEDRELLNKVALNTAELPLPQRADGSTCAAYDCDGDGVVTIKDYAGDPRVGDRSRNGVLDAGDLILAFSDGVDQDHNGYVDDIAGWDFWRDDNNAYDEVRFGHGTGEAKGSAAETNNGIGGAGVCPLCRVVPVRVGDSFVVHGDEFAMGVLFAVDSGAEVIQSAVGAISWSPTVQAALDYAWSKGVVMILSAADEDSFHHNMPGALEHTIVTKAVEPNSADGVSELHAYDTTTYQQHEACTNWGAHIELSSPSTSCSSGATEILAGTAGLVVSRAKDLGLHLTAGQFKQALIQGADDIDHPESILGPASLEYPSQPGFDAYFGYGRTNAKKSVDLISATLADVDIQKPRWFQPIPWHAGLGIPIEGRAGFPDGCTYRLVVEVAKGVQPTDADYTVLSDTQHQGMVDGVLATWSPADAPRGPPGGPDDFTYTLRVRVDDGAGHKGEDRKAIGLYQDPTLHSLTHLGASLESSPALADLDGDGVPEVVQSDGGGRVHALRADGSELPGWPVLSDVFAGAVAHASEAAFAGIALPRDGFVSSPAVADLDGDGKPEVVAASLGGNVYVWHADGTRAIGFRFGADHAYSNGPTQKHDVRWGFLGTPVLADLDKDGHPDIVVGGYDQHLYAWNHRAESLPGFPVLLRDAASPGPFDVGNEIVSSPAVADLDGDGFLDVVVGTNEVYREPRPLPPLGDQLGLGGSGRIYAVDHLGRVLPGWPARPTSIEPRALPLVGSGVPQGPSIVMIGGQPKVALSAFAGDILVYNGDGTVWRQLLSPPFGGSTEPLGIPSVGNGAWGDLDGDGHAEYALGLTGIRAAVRFLLNGHRLDWQSEMGLWDPQLAPDSPTPLPTGAQGMAASVPGWPHVVEDWMFFVQPAIGDVGGLPGQQEVVAGTGGYLVHALTKQGIETPDNPLGAPALSTWPKYTGGWMTASAAIGDLDGDGHNNVVIGTREGDLFVWDTSGGTAAQWPMFKHDAARSGLLG